jgi:hypothetical protein
MTQKSRLLSQAYQPGDVQQLALRAMESEAIAARSVWVEHKQHVAAPARNQAENPD